MKSILKVIVGFLIVIVFLVFMVSSTVVFFLLSPRYYINSFNSPGVYTNIQKGLKASARDSLRSSLTKENIDYNTLTVGERQLIDSNIDTILSPINEDNIRDFTEKNITNILDYINAKSQNLIIYLPLEKWNLKSEAIQQLPDYLKTTNVDVLKVSNDYPETNINSAQITRFYNLGGKARYIWIITLVVLFLLVFIHLALGDKQFRFVKTGRLITGSGILILFFAWIIKIFQNTFGQNIAVRSEANDILIGTIVSALLNYIFIFWIVSSVIIIITGLIMFNIKGKKGRVV